VNEPGGPPVLAVLPVHPADLAAAETLGAELGLPVLVPGSDPAGCPGCDLVLWVEGELLALQATQREPGQSRPGPVRVEFGAAAMRHRRRAGHNELLGRAVGVLRDRRPRVLDATAGLGQDAFVLADLGCEVILCERDPVVAALLRSGMRVAAAGGDEWLRCILGRMTLCPGDAREQAAGEPVDVIYLDPMFPARGKSAAVRKEMVVLQGLLAAGDTAADADALLHWALAQGARRVVVKRPTRAPHLAQLQPSHAISGRAVRFDVYQRPRPATATTGDGEPNVET